MLQFSQEQLDVVHNIIEGSSLIIEGPPGCGKTAVIKSLAELLAERNVFTTIHKTASTGIAALELNAEYESSARTVSSFLRLGIYDFSREEIRERNKDRLSHVCTGDIFIIDEAFGLTDDQLAQIDIALQTITGINWPFGGCQMILLGDPCQIAPEYGASWKHSKLIEEFLMIELDYSFRHANDPDFLEHLNWLRETIKTNSPINLSSWWRDLRPHLEHVYETDKMIISPLFSEAQVINTQRQAVLAEDMEEIILRPLSRFENAPIAPYDELKLSIGTPVVHILNRNGLVNGSRGIVVDIESYNDNIIIEDNNGSMHQVCRERITDQHSAGETFFHPLLPAFALSTRKIQGMTITKGTISAGFLSDDINLRTLYTALSRFTHRRGISYLSV